jgi:hypothetical protein
MAREENSSSQDSEEKRDPLKKWKNIMNYKEG